MHSVKLFRRVLINSRLSEGGHIPFLLKNLKDYNSIKDSDKTDIDHIIAAAEWLERAQDSTQNGGISGRYSLTRGWTSAYPETTGYIIPTFLRLSNEFNLPRFADRAEKAVEFLLKLQMNDGSFPGNEVDENTSVPSIFDTAQIIHGLLHWYLYSKEEEVLNAAIKAGNWLVSVQDKDGAWRKAVYLDQVYTYSAHASCWLAELGQFCDNSNFITSAEKHLNWVLNQLDKKTYWIDLAGFTATDHAKRISVTHTIAYTFWGVLYISKILNNGFGINAVEEASKRIIETQEKNNYLPGILDHNWEARSEFTCLTGNAQMALIWLELYKMRSDDKFLNAAIKAIDSIKKVQCFDNSNSGIRGGIPGSYPIWGEYIYMALPNWAAKFFIDAVLGKIAVQKTKRN